MIIKFQSQILVYKIPLTQSLKPNDHGVHRMFVNWTVERRQENHLNLENWLYPEKCGVIVGRVVLSDLICLKMKLGVSVNGARYRTMISDYLWINLEGMDVQTMWFPQNGATLLPSKRGGPVLLERHILDTAYLIF